MTITLNSVIIHFDTPGMQVRTLLKLSRNKVILLESGVEFTPFLPSLFLHPFIWISLFDPFSLFFFDDSLIIQY